MSDPLMRPVPSPSSSRVRSRVLLASIAMAGLVLVCAGPATAQDDPEPTPTTPLVITESDADPAVDPDSPIGEIIPGPNSGARPERPGDRGGSLQLALFALLLTFMALAAWRIAVGGRSGRQAHAARTRSGAADGPDGRDAGTDADEAGAVTNGGSEPSPRDD